MLITTVVILNIISIKQIKLKKLNKESEDTLLILHIFFGFVCGYLYKYSICSVLVHSGGVHGGHYYAFIRPTLSDQWYGF